MGQPESRSTHPRICRDGQTVERQLAFLDALHLTRSAAMAARAVGMSRESAYRLRRHPEAVLFAAVWDRAMQGRISANFAARRGNGDAAIFPRKSAANHGKDDSQRFWFERAALSTS
jgi:hypothetical protein